MEFFYGICFPIQLTARIPQMLSWSWDSLNLLPGCSENVDVHKTIDAYMLEPLHLQSRLKNRLKPCWSCYALQIEHLRCGNCRYPRICQICCVHAKRVQNDTPGLKEICLKKNTPKQPISEISKVDN